MGNAPDELPFDEIQARGKRAVESRTPIGRFNLQLGMSDNGVPSRVGEKRILFVVFPPSSLIHFTSVLLEFRRKENCLMFQKKFITERIWHQFDLSKSIRFSGSIFAFISCIYDNRRRRKCVRN